MLDHTPHSFMRKFFTQILHRSFPFLYSLGRYGTVVYLGRVPTYYYTYKYIVQINYCAEMWRRQSRHSSWPSPLSTSSQSSWSPSKGNGTVPVPRHCLLHLCPHGLQVQVMAQFLALAIVYFISVLMVSKYR